MVCGQMLSSQGATRRGRSTVRDTGGHPSKARGAALSGNKGQGKPTALSVAQSGCVRSCLVASSRNPILGAGLDPDLSQMMWVFRDPGIASTLRGGQKRATKNRLDA